MAGFFFGDPSSFIKIYTGFCSSRVAADHAYKNGEGGGTGEAEERGKPWPAEAPQTFAEFGAKQKFGCNVEGKEGWQDAI